MQLSPGLYSRMATILDPVRGTVAGHERRREPRMAVQGMGTVAAPGMAVDAAATVHVQDVSLGGASLIASRDLAVGEQLVLVLEGRDGSAVSLLCSVAHCRQVSQDMYVVGAQFLLLGLRKKVSNELQNVIDEAYRSLREATGEIRTFTYLLHASQVDEEGICAMLERYVPGFERRTGIVTALRANERADELPGELQHALLRITQESLGNIQRHAGATHAAVNLRCIGGSVHLVVCDNGKGVAAEEREQLAERMRLGLGIPGVTVRVRSSHCRNCGDCEGKGTAIHVSVPIWRPVPVSARGIANIAREALGAGRG